MLISFGLNAPDFMADLCLSGKLKLVLVFAIVLLSWVIALYLGLEIGLWLSTSKNLKLYMPPLFLGLKKLDLISGNLYSIGFGNNKIIYITINKINLR